MRARGHPYAAQHVVHPLDPGGLAIHAGLPARIVGVRQDEKSGPGGRHTDADPIGFDRLQAGGAGGRWRPGGRLGHPGDAPFGDRGAQGLEARPGDRLQRRVTPVHDLLRADHPGPRQCPVVRVHPRVGPAVGEPEAGNGQGRVPRRLQQIGHAEQAERAQAALVHARQRQGQGDEEPRLRRHLGGALLAARASS